MYEETPRGQLSDQEVKDMGSLDALNDLDHESATPRNVAATSGAGKTIRLEDNEFGQSTSVGAFVVMLISGLFMFALSLFAWLKDPVSLLGTWGPIATLAGLLMGGMIILGSVYYIMKSFFSRK